MEKYIEYFKSIDKKILLIAVFTFLIIIVAVVLAGSFFVSNETSRFQIKNKYYSFELKAPKSWFAEKNTVYSEENIARMLSICKNDELKEGPNYKIGVYRFDDQRYPAGISDVSAALNNFLSRAVLEIEVDCIPDGVKVETDSSKNGAMLEINPDLKGFEKIKETSLVRNNFRYKIGEYVYIAPTDKLKNEKTIKDNYATEFNKIISSFKVD